MKKKLLLSFFVAGLLLVSCEKVGAIQDMVNPQHDLQPNKVVLITDVTIWGKGYVYYSSTNESFVDSCYTTTLYHIVDTIDVTEKNFVYLNVYSMQDSLTIDYSIKAHRGMVYFEIESGRVVNKPSVIVQRNLDLAFLAKMK
jgi:hypothetical protein